MEDHEYKAEASESDSRASKEPLYVFKQESSFKNVWMLCLHYVKTNFCIEWKFDQTHACIDLAFHSGSIMIDI